MATNNVVAKTENILNIKDIKDAQNTIRKYARETPMVQSMFLSRQVADANVYLKVKSEIVV